MSNQPPIDEKTAEELRALRDDLYALYDNAESFYDPDSALIHKLRIVNLSEREHPAIMSIEVDGREVFRQQRAAFLAILKGFGEKLLIEQYQVSTWEEVQERVLQEDEFIEVERHMYYFFARNMPKLLVNIYNIIFLMTEISGLRYHLDERERRENEAGIKKQLATAVRDLEKDIYRMLETRTKGRPRGTTKSPEKKAQEAQEFESQVENAIKHLSKTFGAMPTKTAVAKELGIGGFSVRTGVDSSLNVFNNKLKRLGIDYDAIIQRVNK